MSNFTSKSWTLMYFETLKTMESSKRYRYLDNLLTIFVKVNYNMLVLKTKITL